MKMGGGLVLLALVVVGAFAGIRLADSHDGTPTRSQADGAYLTVANGVAELSGHIDAVLPEAGIGDAKAAREFQAFAEEAGYFDAFLRTIKGSGTLEAQGIAFRDDLARYSAALEAVASGAHQHDSRAENLALEKLTASQAKLRSDRAIFAQALEAELG
jgi:hypothetical protein